jgi:glycine cleavage system H lipoate-binding protein
MNTELNRQQSQPEGAPAGKGTKFVEIFGFSVPTDTYYLHRGHAWAKIEDSGRVRVGLDDFSQKIFGPADTVEFPEIGSVYYQNHVCMALVREGHKAKIMAPVDGRIQEINPRVRQEPRLLHDDPYNQGWLFLIQPTNLSLNLNNLHYGAETAAWIDQESHRLLSLIDTEVGVTLPDGGAVVDDVYGHFPKVGWRRLVREFLLQDLTRTWKKRY